jgi:uncharacterized membrane protein YqaE (UPF0057 family)
MIENIETMKLVIGSAFSFSLLIVVAFIVWKSGARKSVTRNFTQIVTILLTIPSIVLLGVLGLFNQDAIIGILGSIVGYTLGVVASNSNSSAQIEDDK